MYQLFHPRRLLPGLATGAAAPTVDGLPRMDVALFIGFAARGPCHRPIVIDSAGDFQSVFGGDLALAHDPGTGTALKAALPAAVRHYFGNGGTRAHVIRVCRTAELARRLGHNPIGSDVAGTRVFTVPGASVGGAALVVRAASLGSWADGMKVAARLDRTAPGRLRLMLRADLDGARQIIGPFGLSPQDADSWWAVLDDDAHHAVPGANVGARALLAPHGAPGLVDVGGLDDNWSEALGADPEPRTPLERDGLSLFDADLFLDPALTALGVGTLAEAATQQRDILQLPLLGLHGAFAVAGGGDFGEPSLMAVPDAVQPGWTIRVVPPLPPPQPGPAAVPPSWRGHRSNCAAPAGRAGAKTIADAPPLAGPDAGAILDCGTRLLLAPEFTPPETPRGLGALTLAWSASEPGSMYTLEEAGRADFADAVVIWEGKALSHDLLISREGAYYYRVTASLDSNISLPDVTGVQALASLWEQAESYDNRTLLSVQQALIRTAAAIGDQLALLALPVQYGAGDVAAHVDALAAPFLAEPRPLSFAALFHPWPVAMGDDGAVAVPPEGAVAGSHAVRARRRGAWIAAAGQPLADIVALSPALASSDAEALAMNRLNRLHQTPDGFVVSDVFTLSPEHDWRWINVRRLVSLLRRVTVRQGAAFVFEPNGDTLRRAIERIFGHMLADLGRRGAFAGSGGDDSWRLAVDADARSQDDGRLVIEIGIAPAQPLRFLTLVLTQQGARFGVAEER